MTDIHVKRHLNKSSKVFFGLDKQQIKKIFNFASVLLIFQFTQGG